LVSLYSNIDNEAVREKKTKLFIER